MLTDHVADKPAIHSPKFQHASVFDCIFLRDIARLKKTEQSVKFCYNLPDIASQWLGEPRLVLVSKTGILKKKKIIQMNGIMVHHRNCGILAQSGDLGFSKT